MDTNNKKIASVVMFILGFYLCKFAFSYNTYAGFFTFCIVTTILISYSMNNSKSKSSLMAKFK